MTDKALVHLDPDHVQGQLHGLIATVLAIAAFLPRDAFVNEFKARLQAQRDVMGFCDASDLRSNGLDDFESSLLDQLS